MSDVRRAVLAGIGALVLALPMVAAPSARAAGPYTMQTTATYAVAPDEGTIDVTVAVTFTNTTPNPAGRYSEFGTVPIAVQDGATAVAARDSSGTLKATLGTSGGGSVVTVRLRSPLRYGRSATFTMTYRLADGANPDVHVRSTAVIVPVWSYGTVGSVSVTLPAGFQVATSGEPLTTSAANGMTVLSSGDISDPSGWLSLLTATRISGYQTMRRSIALRGGTMDLQVRAWTDDTAWGTQTLDLLATGFPALQDTIGLPYTTLGPLVVTESLPAAPDQPSESPAGAQAIDVAFDARPFTILHQAAHVWLGSALAGERWLREGLASEAAERVAGQEGLALPYDPARERAARAGAALPLRSWTEHTGSGPVSAQEAATDAYGYAASWDVMDQIVARVGQDGLQAVLARVASGVGAYDPTPPAGADAASGTVQPLTSERFLDQLEQVSGRDLSPLFADQVFAAADAQRLADRSAARTEYGQLVVAAGDWGVPQPIRTLMADWRFDDARAATREALAWLPQRDALVAALSSAGLSAPDRLASLWRSNGADERTRGELEAESAFVTAYRNAEQAIGGDPGPVERVGLLGGSAPRELLATAAGRFAEGDLSTAADLVARAVTLDRDAQATGVIRLAVGVALLAVIAAGASVLPRRLRVLRNRASRRAGV